MTELNKSILVEGREIQILKSLLLEIYSPISNDQIEEIMRELLQILEKNTNIRFSSAKIDKWNASSSVLITYPDAVFKKENSTLKTLLDLIENDLNNFVTTIHILPFLKSTSDGGFAVSSHDELEEKFGDWKNIREFSKRYTIMADLVLNHVSSSHQWVKDFIAQKSPNCKYILSPKIDSGWNNVVRPRSSSLFTNLKTTTGNKDVWSTFGPDQIDVDWSNPSVLIEFIKIIILYFNNGISWIRLDAIAFIWKEENTNCLHLDQVHLIVKFLKIILNKLFKHSVIITETNVPEKENISYLISGNEADIAYNFTLPPLLLEAVINNKADLLNKWLNNWPKLPKNTTFLNFTSSHDGIGLRALEGLMDNDRIHSLLVNCEKRGGLISHRRMPNGEDSPYELNISWWSAMADSGIDPSHLQLKRFFLTQLFTMAIQGIPAFYLQSIFASENDYSTFGQTGQRRDLNRHKFEANSLAHILKQKNSIPNKIISFLKNAMSIRSQNIAFHPESPMNCLSLERTDFVIILRGGKNNKILAIHNMTNMRLNLSISEYIDKAKFSDFKRYRDILNNRLISNNFLELDPYSVMWIKGEI